VCSLQTIGMTKGIQRELLPMPRDAWHISHNKNGEPNSCPDHPICSRGNAHSIS